VGAVVDIGLVGRVQDCSAATFRVWSEFLIQSHQDHKLTLTMNQEQTLSWQDYLKGCRARYRPKDKDLAVVCKAKRQAPISSEERQSTVKHYIRNVIPWANSATMKRTLPKVARDAVVPGTLVLQPNPSGGIGHASIVLDMVVGPGGEKRYLIGMGFLPAQDFFVTRPPGTPAAMGAWCTLDEFEAFLSHLGSEYVYRTYER